jgi:hypothetical protein
LALVMFRCHARAPVLQMTWSIIRKSATAEAARQSRAVPPPRTDKLALTRRSAVFASSHTQLPWRISRGPRRESSRANASGGANFTIASHEGKRSHGPQAEQQEYKTGDMVKVRATVTGGKRCWCFLIQLGAWILYAFQIKRWQKNDSMRYIRKKRPLDHFPCMTLQLTCESLATGGEGVCRLDNGLVCFVHRAWPGEVLWARIIKVSKQFVNAVKTETVSLHNDAAGPTCRHFGPCGGCAFQSIQYEAQLKAKRLNVVDSLRRIAGCETAEELVLPTVSCDAQYG